MSKASNEVRIRKLREQAFDHVERGHADRAASRFSELEQLEPRDAEWSRRLADCHRRSGNQTAEVAALTRASRKYAQAGFTLKAIAMCKLVLARCPDDREALEELSRLHGGRSAAPAPRAPSGRRLPPPRPGRAPPPPRPLPTVPPDAALGEVRLDELVPMVELSEASGAGGPGAGGVYELDVESVVDAEPVASEPRVEPARASLDDRLRRAPLFSEVDAETFERLIEDVELVSVAVGDEVFAQGDAPGGLYVVAEGALVAAVAGPVTRELARYAAGDVFGEMGLVSNQRRGASVRATADSQLLCLTRRAVSQLSSRAPGFMSALLRVLRERFVENLLEDSELLVALRPDERRNLVERFKFLDVAAGTTLLAQGARASGLFILLGGRCRVIFREPGEERCLAELDCGDVFGEMSLLGGERAFASVTATSRSFLLRADAEEFLRISMVHPTVLEQISRLRDQRQALNARQLQSLERSRLTLL